MLALAVTDPGDEWLLPDPGYPSNRHLVRSFEGVARALPVDATTASSRPRPRCRRLDGTHPWADGGLTGQPRAPCSARTKSSPCTKPWPPAAAS
jgi:hypothetical protein